VIRSEFANAHCSRLADCLLVRRNGWNSVKPASVDLQPNNTANDVWTNTTCGRKPNRAIGQS